jgi:DNA-directed RNA polymerase sigma subunit (sigma70/sigma32)
MIYWSIQTLILSIVLILLVHHLILFFKETLTIPKIKDLVNTTDDKYENMYKIISNAKTVASIDTIQGEKDSSTTLLSLLPNPVQESAKDSVNIESMKDELRSFLKKNMQAPESYGSSVSFSSFS